MAASLFLRCRRALSLAAALSAAAALGGGCGGGDEAGAPLDVPPGCNPLAFEHDCLLPYPSDYFRRDEGSGPIVHPDNEALVHEPNGEIVDPYELHPADGFSPGSQILALFPQGIDDGPLLGAADDLAASAESDSPTLLVEADSGHRVLHIAEIDPRSPSPERQALAIRPAERLRDGARYVVGLHGLRDRGGALLPAPRGFALLRDGLGGDEPALSAEAARFEADVFAPLEQAGVARAELQLAWDFTVRSRDNVIGDMLAVRAQTIAYFSTHPPEIQVVSVEEQPDAHTFRRLEATVEVPLFVESEEPGARLLRDGAGQVVSGGTATVPFTVLVPESVANRPPGAPPARLLQYGHGFFGGREEINDYANALGDERGFVVVAADWWGMAKADRTWLTDTILTDHGGMARFTDRVHQAMANFMAVAYAASGPLVSLPELQLGEPPIYDPANVFFYGISQGHILGGTYLGLSPLVERGALGSGGANLSFICFRSRAFLAFLAVIGFVTPDPLDQQKLMLMFQTSFDRIDPLTYAPLVLAEPLGDGPASSKQVLLQIGVGDAAVPPLSAHLHARALGLAHLQPAPRPIVGLVPSDGPTSSAITEFDFGIDPLPDLVAVPSTQDNEVHEAVRRLEAAKEQLDRYFRPDGLIEHTCDGPCDPE